MTESNIVIKTDDHQGDTKFIEQDSLNDDVEEADMVLRKALQLKPFHSENILPSTVYLQKQVMPIIYEALEQVDKIRPKDPIEFFCAYILEKNKK
jgi:hypothetical protein